MDVSLNFCRLLIILKMKGYNQGISQVNKSEGKQIFIRDCYFPNPDGSLKTRHLPDSVPDLSIFTDHQRVILY